MIYVSSTALYRQRQVRLTQIMAVASAGDTIGAIAARAVSRLRCTEEPRLDVDGADRPPQH
jgi:hypothetical protein